MPRLQATVPEGAPANALLRVRLPDGEGEILAPLLLNMSFIIPPMSSHLILYFPFNTAEVKVRVPSGLSPGDEFQFEVTAFGEIINTTSCIAKKSDSGNSSGKLKSKNPKKKRHHHNHLSEQQHKSTSRQDANRNTPLFISVCLDMYQKLYQMIMYEYEEEDVSTPSSSGGNNGDNGRRLKSQTPSATTTTRTVNESEVQYLGFLDRDLINGQDFITALAVGIFIGSSVVLGFLAGVLYVTPLPE